MSLTTQGGNASLVDSIGLVLGNISTNGGNLDLTAGGAGFSQAANTSINTTTAASFGVTGGTATFTASATGASVLLGNQNNFGGTVTFTANANISNSVSFHNINLFAALPTGLPTILTGDLNLNFDNAAIALATESVATLEVSSGGAGGITQQTATTLMVSGASSFTVSNDAPILLTNAGNSFTGAVAFTSSVSDQSVSLANTVATVIGASSLGRGAFSVLTTTGNITESGAIVQAQAAGTATFSTTTGTTINLITQANDFTGQVVAAGASVTTFDLRNTDELAQFANLTFSASVTTLSVEFDNAPILVGNLSIPTVTLNSAFGIFQTAGTSITAATLLALIDTGTATPILLSNANDIADVTVTTTGNTGNVLINNGTNNLNFTGVSSIGTGRLVVTAGNITQVSPITTAGRASFTSSGSISLDVFGNSFGGQVDASVTGSNNLTIDQENGTLILGNISIGTGQLTVNTNTNDASGIAQAGRDQHRDRHRQRQRVRQQHQGPGHRVDQLLHQSGPGQPIWWFGVAAYIPDCQRQHHGQRRHSTGRQPRVREPDRPGRRSHHPDRPPDRRWPGQFQCGDSGHHADQHVQ